MSAFRSRPIVTLTSDFGSGSSYVAQMKGVLLSRNPELSVIDISHSIAPQNIREGALLLADTCPRFPADTIHLVVVDPGVGTERRIVYARIGTQRFIAPDNGILTLLAQCNSPTQLVNVTKRLYFLPEVSCTFHGRDIMAPVAAHLSLGLNPQLLGPPLESLVVLPFPQPTTDDRQITGQVLHIDSFGNLITNITGGELSAIPENAGSIMVSCKSATTSGMVASYGQRPPGSLIALVGSSGRLEVAVVNGSAEMALSASVDDPVRVTWSP